MSQAIYQPDGLRAEMACRANQLGSIGRTPRETLDEGKVNWWMGRTGVPSQRAHWRYQFFMPVLFVGPIHRLQTFERQAERRRRDAADFCCRGGARADRPVFGGRHR